MRTREFERRKARKIFEHWQLPYKLQQLLRECKAKDTSRYAIDGINIKENEITATDGRRLFVLTIPHEIPPGLYWMTSEGYLLGHNEGNFPEYKDIVPIKESLKHLGTFDLPQKGTLGLIISAIVGSGCAFDVNLFYRLFQLLIAINASPMSVYVHKKETKKSPFLLEGKCDFGDFKYVQMPVNL